MRTTFDVVKGLVTGSVKNVSYSSVGQQLSRMFGSYGTNATELYGQSPVLFPIVNKLANRTASVGWHMHRDKNLRTRTSCEVCGEEGAANVPDHLALRVWNRPNPFFNRQEFVEALEQHVDLCGESFWIVEFHEGTTLPRHLWLRRPDTMCELTDGGLYDLLTGWETYGPNRQKIPFGLDEVIQVKNIDPSRPWRGIGPVQATLKYLGFQDIVVEWQNSFFRNNATPPGALSIPGISDTERKVFQAELNMRHGGVSNAHRVSVMNREAKWTSMTYSMEDMQFEQLYRLAGEVVRTAFNFPKFFLGEPEDSNRAASEAAQDFFDQELVLPRLERIKAVLNDDFLKMFGSTGEGVQFVYINPVKGNQELKNATRLNAAQVFQTLVGAGVDPEDAAWQAGLPPLKMVSSAAQAEEEVAA